MYKTNVILYISGRWTSFVLMLHSHPLRKSKLEVWKFSLDLLSLINRKHACFLFPVVCSHLLMSNFTRKLWHAEINTVALLYSPSPPPHCVCRWHRQPVWELLVPHWFLSNTNAADCWWISAAALMQTFHYLVITSFYIHRLIYIAVKIISTNSSALLSVQVWWRIT